MGKKLVNEFKEFISRGNVVDLAVGVIIGGAFTSIVTSLVNDIVMPIVGLFVGGVNFTDLKYIITPATGDVAEAAIYYGNFIQSVVNFLLVACVIFSVIKVINRFHKREEAAPPPPAAPAQDIVLLREIRDLLSDQTNAR